MKFRFWHFSSNLTVNSWSYLWCFFHSFVRSSMQGYSGIFFGQKFRSCTCNSLVSKPGRWVGFSRKQRTSKTHRFVNPGLALFPNTLQVFHMMFLSVLLWIKWEAAHWWRWEDCIYRQGKAIILGKNREYPRAGSGCEKLSENDLGVSASQKPWQPAFVLIK